MPVVCVWRMAHGVRVCACRGVRAQVETSHWVGQWAKLAARPARGQLDVKWDLDASAERITAVKQRRADASGEGTGDTTPDRAGLLVSACRRLLPLWVACAWLR